MGLSLTTEFPKDIFVYTDPTDTQMPFDERMRLYHLRKATGEKSEWVKENKNLRNEFIGYIKDDEIASATELIVKHLLDNNHIYTTKDDLKSEMWIYKGGIYLPQGKSELKWQIREILGKWFNMFYYNQIIAKIEADTFIEMDKFFKTSYPDELPIQNGILNIFTRELSPFTPKKIFFNKMPVEYNKAATCLAIDCFLNDVLSNQEDKLVFYEFVGFGLLKEYRYEKAAMFVGNGRNGKGKSLELLKRLFGIENCAALSLSCLNSNSFDIYELFAKQLNLAGDIGNKDLQDTSMFKSLTGRDLVTIKRKFLNGFSFENYAKFIFACNELPSVYDMSRGFWDRWVLLEFPYTFVCQDEFDKSSDKSKLKIKDENIIAKIVTSIELSGLLNQALDGLDRLIKNHNFSVTMGTKEIKDLWIRKSNSAIAFCSEFVQDGYEDYITKREFRKRYADFCKKHNIASKSDFVIKKALQEMFGANDERKVIDFDLVYVWTGVKWKD